MQLLKCSLGGSSEVHRGSQGHVNSLRGVAGVGLDVSRVQCKVVLCRRHWQQCCPHLPHAFGCLLPSCSLFPCARLHIQPSHTRWHPSTTLTHTPPHSPPALKHSWTCKTQRCFKAAVNAGFSGLQILNHIDSQDGSQWRNFLNFDPSAKYGGWSYEDIVVRPTSEALKAVIKPKTKVRMTVRWGPPAWCAWGQPSVCCWGLVLGNARWRREKMLIFGTCWFRRNSASMCCAPCCVLHLQHASRHRPTHIK